MAPLQDLSERSIVITGATSGLGWAAAQALEARGAYVLGVGRSSIRCAQVQSELRTMVPSSRTAFLVADLSSQRQVLDLAASIRSRLEGAPGGKLDVLINNAAAVSSWFMATEDGYELQFAVNHLAPFLLTHELLPLLERAPSPRVITVSSGSHRGAEIHWKDVMFRRHYGTLKAYQQSKLANVLFTAEFNRRAEGHSRICAYAADPGLVNTAIGSKQTYGIARWFWEWRRRSGASAERGAETILFLAADPSVEGSREPYWRNCRPVAPSEYALREAEAARLWDLSERLCGITYPWHSANGPVLPDAALGADTGERMASLMSS